jgi:Skp family chaperone for outer membrane proteins
MIAFLQAIKPSRTIMKSVYLALAITAATSLSAQATVDAVATVDGKKITNTF